MSGDDAFTITPAEIKFAGILVYASSIPGVCVCFLVLVSYAVAACFEKARKELDRVSFRLLVYTLIFNVLFGISFAATPTRPGGACNVRAFVVNFTLSFSTFFTTCIAINLQLVLVHGFNGKRMEKFYLIGTTLLSIALNVPTFALHQFGWDDESATCWYNNANKDIRLRWIIGTQSFWISLAATIETVCSCIVLAWLYNYRRTTDNLVNAYRQDPAASGPREVTESSTSSQFVASGPMTYQNVRRDSKFRRVIVRIALYPIISLMINYTTVALDLNTTIVGLNTQLDFRLLIFDLVIYGVRTLAYGLLAAGDPAFITAVRQLLKRPKKHSLINFRVTDRKPPTDGFAQSTMLEDGQVSVELKSANQLESTGDSSFTRSMQESGVTESKNDSPTESTSSRNMSERTYGPSYPHQSQSQIDEVEDLTRQL